MARSRRFTAVLAAAFTALLATTLSALPAAAAPGADGLAAATTGTVSGSISHAEGLEVTLTFVPLSGGGDPQVFSHVLVTPGGSFSALNVERGDYHVRFQSNLGGLQAGWFAGGSTNTLETNASLVTVVAGHATTLIMSARTSPAMITGTIPPLAGTSTWSVAAFAISGGVRDDRYQLSSTSIIDGDTFHLQGLPAGEFRVVIRQISVPQKFSSSAPVSTTLSDGEVDDIGSLNPAPLPGGKPAVVRLAGADRYATALAIAQARFTTTPSNVFIVNGTNFPDALSAVPAAKLKNAPILLVKPGSLPAAVKTQLAEWDPGHVWIIGGPGSVSDAVKNQIDAVTGIVTRVAGADRYSTSQAVATTFFDTSVATSKFTIYLANGGGFADALGAGPAAAYRQGPVVLVKGTLPHLDSATKALIADRGTFYNVQLAGGLGTISQGIDNDLDVLLSGSHDHRRRAGADRYKTAAEIADGTFPYASRVYLAVGSSFPDALAGGAAAAKDKAPILLIQKNCIPAEAFAQLDRLKPNTIYLLGGTGVISDALKTLPKC